MVAPQLYYEDGGLVPAWLHYLAMACLALGAICAAVIAVDETRHPQHMWIMNIVWPATALFGSLWVVWRYFKYGRLAEHRLTHAARQQGKDPPNKRLTPFLTMVGNGTLHCGAGCTLGDIAAEAMMVAFPSIVLAFGYKSVFSDQIFARWIVDYIVAYAFGILFQYFTIAPMRGLSLGQGLIAAVKADTLSLTAWQCGMYGFMAVAHFLIFAGFAPSSNQAPSNFGS